LLHRAVHRCGELSQARALLGLAALLRQLLTLGPGLSLAISQHALGLGLVGGTVQQLAVHTAGGVVTEAQVLMIVVPKDAEVTAEVVLENKDVGFVGAGQQAEVKLETFPFTRYGTVHATVTQLSADAVNDEKRGAIFPATLKLNQTDLDVDGKRIALAPGMNLSAEIKTGKRRVIDYLLSPVQRAGDESLKER
jgi:hemolysin D